MKPDVVITFEKQVKILDFGVLRAPLFLVFR